MNGLGALRRERLAEPTVCGSLWLDLNGVECALRCSGGLWLPREQTVVFADLHLEKGSAYAARGQLLPPYDTCDVLDRLEAELRALEPKVVVLLGDSFHDARALERLTPQNAIRLAALAFRRTLIWVEGNHDVALLTTGASTVPGETMAEVNVAGLVLRHEPQPGFHSGEVAGHLHPCAKLVRGRAGGRRRAFILDGRRIVLPAFGAYAGGLNVRDAAFQALFEGKPLVAALGDRRVHPLPWNVLG